MKRLIHYKIRRRSDGKFSTGGSTPGFSKMGKVWKQKSHLTSHLSQLFNNGLAKHLDPTCGPFSAAGDMVFSHIYENCEIVEYEMIEVSKSDVMDRLNEVAGSKEARNAIEQSRIKKVILARRRKQWEELNEEFGSNDN